jgi:2,3-bisphosphoglycerate-dependent phosphoglycerate mutase
MQVMPDGLLVLVRHGQSQWNLENRFTGWVDIPLTAVGRGDAQRAGSLLRGYHFDHAFTSALSRAQETLEIILDTMHYTHVPVEKSAALNERNYGDLQGMNKDEARTQFGAEQVQRWRRSYDERPPNGESLKDTLARTLPYYRVHIEPLLLQGRNVLVVAHGNSLRSLIMYLENISEQAIPDLNLELGAPLSYRINNLGGVVNKIKLG